MIKSENRLRKNKHFKYIYHRGETKSLGYIVMSYITTKFDVMKVGFSVSKKIGKSVVRNKVKRRLRECFCALKKNINPHYNYIFGAKVGIENLSFEQIKNNMMELLKKNGLYVESN